jgi:hypothetical protein
MARCSGTAVGLEKLVCFIPRAAAAVLIAVATMSACCMAAVALVTALEEPRAGAAWAIATAAAALIVVEMGMAVLLVSRNWPRTRTPTPIKRPNVSW